MSENKKRFLAYGKPRFDRSKVKVVKADLSNRSFSHGPIAIDKTTKWGVISDDTLDELLSKDDLSEDRRKRYLEIKRIRALEKKSAAASAKIKNHEDFETIIEVSMVSMDDPKRFSKIKKLIADKKNKSFILESANKIRELNQNGKQRK
jgi:hypothetical protein